MTAAPPSSAAIPPSVTSSSGAPVGSDRRDMQAWFDLVFAGLGPARRIELRYLIPDDEKYPTVHETIGDAAAAALRGYQRFNVYAGMTWRRPGHRGRKEDCTATRVLWVEYDTKHHGGDHAIPLLRLSTFELLFSAIIWTGGGFYALVRLAEHLDRTALPHAGARGGRQQEPGAGRGRRRGARCGPRYPAHPPASGHVQP